jgi:glycosyltransferase involved in cell wall biosynthesis
MSAVKENVSLNAPWIEPHKEEGVFMLDPMSRLAVGSKRLRDRMIATIEASGLFDFIWYESQLSREELTLLSVIGKTSNVPLIAHYVDIGSRLGLQPHPLFCPRFYREWHKDVAQKGVEPFYHFLTSPLHEYRDPHILFSSKLYQARSKSQGLAIRTNVLKHYTEVGHKKRISPHVLFDIDYYEQRKIGLGISGAPSGLPCTVITPLTEYLLGSTDCDPHPLFHQRYYYGLYPALKRKGINPLVHFLYFGYGERSSPHPLFSSDYYLWMNPDVHQAHLNPLLHYVEHGEKEYRDPSPFFSIRYYSKKYFSDELTVKLLEHFVCYGWKKGFNPSSWIDMSQVLQKMDPEGFYGDDLAVEFFGRLYIEKPNTATAPELYFALKGLEKGSDPLKTYLNINKRQDRALDSGRIEKCNSAVRGLSYYGPFSVISGLGSACRGYVRAMQLSGIVCHTVPTMVPEYQEEMPFPKSYARKDWRVGLAHINPDATYPFFNTVEGQNFLQHDYRIGFWVWELPSCQREWFTNFVSYDEVWVPSTFCLEAFSCATSLPIRRVPHVVGRFNKQHQRWSAEENDQIRINFRRKWVIPPDAFVYYYIFDASSYVDRKNPLALIKAFREVRSLIDEAHLLLKISYSAVNKRFNRQLKNLLATLPAGSFTVIMDVLSGEQLDELIIASDVCVSPHRSEGFGLTVAEAMLFSKPVIATNFGGVTDFLDTSTGYPVGFVLTELTHDIGPYKKGNIWAEPLHDELCDSMLQVHREPNVALQRARRGAEYIANNFSAEVVGKVILELLT